MPLVEIAADARYRFDEEAGYLEVCPACGAARESARCSCGHGFERRQRGFLTTRWEPPRLEVALPELCPHCLGEPSRTAALWNRQLTRLRGLMAAEATDLRIEVPVCHRVREPIWAYLALVLSLAAAVMFAVLTPVAAAGGGAWPVTLAIAILAAAAAWRCWRAKSWLRFVRFDHRAYRFAVRRAEYAHAFARANGGRVLGRHGAPE